MNEKLESLVNDSLQKIDEAINGDINSHLEPQFHLQNFLEVIREVYSCPGNYKFLIRNLYEKDPYMSNVKEHIVNIVCMFNGLLPEVKKSFSESGFEDLLQYKLQIGLDTANKIVEHYDGHLSFSENQEELIILGAVESVNGDFDA